MTAREIADALLRIEDELRGIRAFTRSVPKPDGYACERDQFEVAGAVASAESAVVTARCWAQTHVEQDDREEVSK